MINSKRLIAFAKSGAVEMDGATYNTKQEFLSTVRKTTSVLIDVDTFYRHLHPETMSDAEYSKEEIEAERKTLVKKIDSAAKKILWLNMLCRVSQGVPFVERKVGPGEDRLELVYAFELFVNELEVSI